MKERPPVCADGSPFIQTGCESGASVCVFGGMGRGSGGSICEIAGCSLGSVAFADVNEGRARGIAGSVCGPGIFAPGSGARVAVFVGCGVRSAICADGCFTRTLGSVGHADTFLRSSVSVRYWLRERHAEVGQRMRICAGFVYRVERILASGVCDEGIGQGVLIVSGMSYKSHRAEPILL